ncbi:sugar phosphate isomerase/epimerase family protein [candidate division KSB1 bacterium]
MTMGRRDFMKVSAAAGAASLVACETAGVKLPPPSKKAVLNLSCQENVAPDGSLTEKLDFLEEHGFVGYEVWGTKIGERVTELQKALDGRSIKISATCSGFEGVIVSEDPKIRRTAVDSMKEILTAAGELKSTGLVMVPAFHGQTKLSHQETRSVLIDNLAELGEHAVKAGSRMLIEPLNRKECYFLRQVADAAAICRDVGSPGVALMADFWHMTFEETSDLGAIISAGDHMRHMHVASRKRRMMPGEDEGDNYVDGFRGMKLVGYTDFLSFECGSVGDKHDTIPAAANLLREQWEMA